MIFECFVFCCRSFTNEYITNNKSTLSTLINPEFLYLEVLMFIWKQSEFNIKTTGTHFQDYWGIQQRMSRLFQQIYLILFPKIVIFLKIDLLESDISDPCDILLSAGSCEHL